MKRTDGSLRGTGKVYAFTLEQMIKGKANLIMLVLLLALSLASVPLMTLFGGTGGARETGFERLYVQNETGLPLELASLADIVTEEDAKPETIQKDEAWLRFYLAEDGYHVDAECDPVDEDKAASLLQNAQSILNEARYASLGTTTEQLKTISTPVQTETGTVTDYLSAPELDFADTFAIQYVYSILVMILSIFASSYIVRAVIEEKASKLVELLMVSVKPLALIVGKILAMMTYVFGLLLLMVVGMVMSYFISGSFMEVASPVAMLQGMGLDISGMNVGPMTVVIVLVSLVLGYLTFSILGGLVGTGCSSMEDVESANLSVILIVMAGYLVASMTSGIGNTAVGTVLALVPVVSVFCAPVQYVCGNINLGMLCVSWLLQGLVLLLLAWLCAKIYHELLLRRGGKVKLREMLSMARRKKGGVAA